jgi:hypothetical protein
MPGGNLPLGDKGWQESCFWVNRVGSGKGGGILWVGDTLKLTCIRVTLRKIFGSPCFHNSKERRKGIDGE